MNTALVGIFAALAIVGLAGVVLGFVVVPASADTPDSGGIFDRITQWWRRLPRARRLTIFIAVIAGVLVSVLTGFIAFGLAVIALGIGIPVLLATPYNRDVVLLEALDRWVRALIACMPTGKSIPDAIRATRKQTPPILSEEVDLLTQRLDEQWTLPEALLAFAQDCDSAEVDEVAAALIVAGRRGGVGVTATLEALADAVQDRLAAAREIELERDKPRVVVRQVTGVIVVVAGLAMLFSPDYFVAYRSGIGMLILVGIVAAYLGVLLKLRSASRSRPRERILKPRQVQEVPV
jgi:Flp pilus assembly protein TadB